MLQKEKLNDILLEVIYDHFNILLFCFKRIITPIVNLIQKVKNPEL
jgi:hypothetical protein